MNITDRVKTFEDACKVLDLDLSLIVHPFDDTKDEKAYKKLKAIVEALNEGWKPNWKNEKEYKYYPWFYIESASGFCLIDVYYYFTGSDVGSRLCFRSADLAKYAATQFLDLYRDFMINDN